MSLDDIRPILETLKPAILPPALKTASLRYRFELEDGRTWDLRLKEGRLSLAPAEGEPDVVMRGPAEEVVRVLTGEANLLTAFMRGDLAIQGSLPAAKMLYTYCRYARTLEAKA